MNYDWVKLAAMMEPTAIDMWLAVIAICLAFDRKIPWMVWGFLAMEIMMMFVYRSRAII
jgi:hypothetical protein